MADQTPEPRGDQGVVTDVNVEESPQPDASQDTTTGDATTTGPAPGSHSAPADLPTAPTTATASGSGGASAEGPADPRTGGESYVVNAGGDPKTFRYVVTDDDGNGTEARIGRVVVRGDGTLALVDLAPQDATERNAREIQLLERRLAEARGEV